MDKWKIIVIVALLAGLSGYGFYQQSASQAPPPPEPDAQTQQTPPNAKIIAMKGQTPPEWNVPADLWVNVPAPMPLSSLKGSVVFVEFWRIGCHHCEEAAPFLEQLYQQYKAKGLKMVTIHTPGAPTPDNPENNWDTVKQTIKKWNISYPVAYDQDGKLFKEVYGGERYPTAMLLDRQGKVQFVETGMDSPEQKQALVANIEKLLAEKSE